MLPRGGAGAAPDPDDGRDARAACRGADDDATVMMPARPGERADGADEDATVMLPSQDDAGAAAEPGSRSNHCNSNDPGRKRDAVPIAPPSTPAAGREAVVRDAVALGGIDPLVGAANRVLAVVPQIRHTLRHPDPAALRASLLGEHRQFRARGTRGRRRRGDSFRRQLRALRAARRIGCCHALGRGVGRPAACWRSATAMATRAKNSSRCWRNSRRIPPAISIRWNFSTFA